MRQVALKNGTRVPALGLGTWKMGEDVRQRAQEVRALQTGLDLGATLIDTAEMYAAGRSEEVVAAAIKGRRDSVYLVSKVLPQNASRAGVVKACDASLKRLKTDRIDLYLLHWRGTVPLAETIEAFEALQRAGKIRLWGVSNLDVSDMDELTSVPGGAAVQTDQVLYNLTRRGIEHDLLPALRERRIPIMAYSPIEQARLARNRKLEAFAERNGMTGAQAALAWVLRDDDVIAIPKTSTPEHVIENLAAADIRLDAEELAELDAMFRRPPPGPLEMI